MGDITLPLTGMNDDGEGAVTITWTSDNDDVIDVETNPGPER